MPLPFRWKKEHMLTVGGLIFVVLVVVLFLVLFGLGNAYRFGLSRYDPETIGSINAAKKTKIKKLIIKKPDEVGCLEVTPEGEVRVYDVCGGDPTAAQRSDSKFIGNIFRLVNEADARKFQDSGAAVYVVVVETEVGQTILYVTSDSPLGNQIIDTITKLKEDTPTPTPVPTGGILPTPTPTLPGYSATPTPTTVLPGSGPTATPTPTINPLIPFTCGFSQDGSGKKPINVSNFICSTEPQPGQ